MKWVILNNKKILATLSLSALLSTVFITTAAPANATPGDSSCDLSSAGSTPGSNADPYLLSTEQDVFEMVDCVDSSTINNFFEMQNDIHLNSEWTNFNFISSNSSGAGFDGGGHILSGLKITSSSSNGGLFEDVNNATIKDLYLEVESVSGESVGSAANFITNSTLNNVHVHAKGDVSGSGLTGGFAAQITGSTVGDVSFVSSARVTSPSAVGGIAATIYNSTIGGLSVVADVESTGSLPSSFAGGIAAAIDILGTSATISGLSFVGAISSDIETGGLFGRAFDGEKKTPSETSLTIEDSSVIGTVNSTTKNPGGFIGTLEVASAVWFSSFKTGSSFVSAEMKKNGVTTTDGAVISPYSANTSVTASTGTFYDTDKANFNVTHSATGKETTQLKTFDQLRYSNYGLERLSDYAGDEDASIVWLISSDLNDGFPVLRSAYDNLVYGAPYRPQSLAITPDAEGFQVSFNEPIFDGGAAIAGYEYSVDDGSNWNSLTTETSAGVFSGEITGLDSDSVYSVTVRALNILGNSPASVPAISKPASADSVAKTWEADDFTIAQSEDQVVSSTSTREGSRSFFEWTLTDDETVRGGAVWSKSRISFEEDFDLSAEIYLGDDSSGADGMAFVMQTSSSTSLSSGGGLGYSAISPVLAVEFDTFNNSGDDAHGNNNDDYWSIKKNSNSSNDSHDLNDSGVVPSNDVDGDGNVETTVKEFTNPINGELEDDQWRKVRFTWDASADEFNAYFDFNADGDTSDNYERLQFENAGLTGNGSLFGTTPIYWGFTSTTGSFDNEHKVRFEQNLLITQTAVFNTDPSFAAPAPFQGPVITNAELEGTELVISGNNLELISSVLLGDNETSVTAAGNQLLVDISDLPAGEYQVGYSYSGSEVSTQFSVNIGEISSESQESAFWTKQVSPTEIKLYAKNIVGKGKIQFFHNGNEVAWARAEDASDPKLRVITSGPMTGANYLVRTRELVEGKNVFEIYIDGERVLRRAQGF